MSGLTELGQVLHEEHFRILVFLCGLENRVTGRAALQPLDSGNPEDRAELEQLIACLDQIIGHNAFEEAVFFPLIWDGGEGELASLLTEEHASIAPLTLRFREEAVALLEYGSGFGRWGVFCRGARKLVARMMQHLQKEELTFVQRLAFFVDADLDHRLAVKHGAERQRYRYAASFHAAAVG
jgi:hemerythrin-like domain-containing protein